MATSLKYDSSQTDVATIGNIYTAVDGGTGQTEATGDDFVSIDTVASPDNLLVGQATNNQVNVNAHTTFAIQFQATKN